MFGSYVPFITFVKQMKNINVKNHIYEKSNPKPRNSNSNLVYHHLYRWINIKCYFYPKLDFLKKCLTTEIKYLTLSDNNSESSLKKLVTETV